MSWMYLFLAGLCETGWAIGMKYTHGFTRLLPSVLTILAMVGSFLLLSKALRQLPLSTSYAVWTGIGIVGTFVFGALLLGEDVAWPQVVCVGLIMSGIIGLRLMA